MKTLKKVLAVVLALAMVLGMAVTASAGYKDAEKINYKEAVAVMSLAGVLNGYTDGSFQPEGTLTRAEAAKMIVYALGLEDTSLGYKANFGDINGHWAETPISVAAGLGIVAGMGNGQYEPNGTLTGFQWAKIILCAMGYDAEIENLVGAGWEAKVAKLMKAVGMDDDLKKFDGSKAVTREEAAQMLFNVVTTGFVGYPETGKAAVTLGTKYYTGRNAKYGETDSFAIRLKLSDGSKNDVETDDADKWGRPGTTWYVNEGKAKKEKSVFIVDEADATYTVPTKQCDIYDDLDLDKATTFDTVFLNGKEISDNVKVDDKKDNLNVTRQGRLVEFYGDDTVVIIDTYLAKVTKVKAAKFDSKDHLQTQAYMDLTVYGLKNKVTLHADEDFSYEKGDVVLINLNYNDVDDSDILGIADVAAAKYTGLKADKSMVKLDGEWVYVAEKFTGKADLGAKCDVYYDQYGNVICIGETETETEYYVIDSAFFERTKGDRTYYANIVGFDGEMTEVVVDDDDTVVASTDNAGDLTNMSDYIYKAVEDDEYTFTKLTDTVVNRVKVENGKKYLNYGTNDEYVVLSEDTQFLFQIKECKKGKVGTYEAYLGYEEVPSFYATSVQVEFDSDDKVEVVYVKDCLFTGETKLFYVIDEDLEAVEEIDGDIIHTFNAYAYEDGELVKKSFQTKDPSEFNTHKSGCYMIYFDRDGMATFKDRMREFNITSNDVTPIADTYKIDVDGKSYRVDEDATVFYEIKDGELVEIEDEDILNWRLDNHRASTATAYFSLKENGDIDTVVAVIFTGFVRWHRH